MRVFVTGATGFIGSAIVQELISSGHQVLGVARSDASAKLLMDAGAEVHYGSLEDMESLRRGVALSDGVIHTAFNHDFSQYKASCEADRQVIEAMGQVLAGTDRPLIITSGTALISNLGRPVTENDKPTLSSASLPRLASEEAAASVAMKGVNVSVVRLPPSVHGDGDHGFVPALIGIAREKGVSAYVGEGTNRWPAVHRFDAAHLYRLVLEKGSAGSVFHAVGDDGIPFREIASIIGRKLDVPVESKSDNEAANHFGWIAHFTTVDNPASSQRTRELLGWQPKQSSLIADLETEAYFKS